MYAYLHQRIRNDEHCPNCRKYYLTVYQTQQHCFKHPKLTLTNNTVWEDEWVRRRNGDCYSYQPIVLGLEYDLNSFEYIECECEQNNYENIQFILICKTVDTRLYCPDNIKYSVWFFNDLLRLTYEIIPDKEDRMELCEEKELILNYSEFETKYFKIICVCVGEPVDINQTML
jgi:hypothetical protein